MIWPASQPATTPTIRMTIRLWLDITPRSFLENRAQTSGPFAGRPSKRQSGEIELALTAEFFYKPCAISPIGRLPSRPRPSSGGANAAEAASMRPTFEGDRHESRTEI